MQDQVTAPASPGAALWLEPCSRAVSLDAVKRWHYLGSMQAVTVDQFAVFEHGAFIGTIVYGSGPRNMPLSVGVEPRRLCELARVALDKHSTPVSRIVAISLRLLRARKPHLQIVVSYADTAVGHYGGIYQAGGWVYTGDAEVNPSYRINGRLIHGRTVHSIYGRGGQSVPWLRENVDPLAERVNGSLKYRYLIAFDDALRRSIMISALPYPKRAKQAMVEHPSTQRQCGTDPYAPS